jgi:hypothetical protein
VVASRLWKSQIAGHQVDFEVDVFLLDHETGLSPFLPFTMFPLAVSR